MHGVFRLNSLIFEWQKSVLIMDEYQITRKAPNLVMAQVEHPTKHNISGNCRIFHKIYTQFSCDLLHVFKFMLAISWYELFIRILQNSFTGITSIVWFPGASDVTEISTGSHKNPTNCRPCAYLMECIVYFTHIFQDDFCELQWNLFMTVKLI